MRPDSSATGGAGSGADALGRLRRSRRLTRLGLATLAGVFVGLGHAPFSVVPLALFGLLLAFLLFVTSVGARQVALTGWVVATTSYAVSLHWIVEPFFVDAVRTGWLAPFALVFMAGGLALFWAAAFGLARRFGGLCLLVMLLTLAEVARGTLLTGFPWNLIGHVWARTPVAQIGSLVGPYGLTLLTLGAVALPLALGLGGRRIAAPVTAALAFGLPWVAGLWIEALPVPDPAPQVLRLVQPNAPQHQKWEPEFAPTFFRRQVFFSAALPRPDLIVWPETSVPELLNHAGGALSYVSDNAGGVPVVLGILRRDAEGRFYNSLVVLGDGGVVVDTYDKHHLVPFGEYLPLPGFFDAIGLSVLGDFIGGGFDAGPGPRLIDLGPLGRALPLICYEAVFPQDVAGAPERPGFLLQITNDAWFGTFSGPYQHLAQARMRAIEQGLPMLRAANTGISAVIDARGRVIDSLPLGRAGYLDVHLPAALPPTIYAHTGDAPLIVVLLLLSAALVAFRRNFD